MRKIAFILASILAVSTALTACGGSGDTTSDTSGGDTTPEVTSAAEFAPADLNFGGEQFVIAEHDIGDWMQSTFIEEENGEVLNDAIYKRNITIEEMYNVDLVGYKIEGTRNTGNMEQITKSIEAGDKEFDVAMIPGTHMPKILNRPDYFIPLSDVDTLDLTKSWWDQNSVETMTIGDNVLTCTGDMVVTTHGASTLVFFNKDLAEKYNLDVYGMVNDGKFTIDNVWNISKQVSDDLNGDTVRDGFNDQFGAYFEMLNLNHLVLITGEHLVANNSEGYPEFALETPKAQSIVEKFVTMIDDKDNVLFAQDRRDEGPFSIFDSGRLLFFITNIQRTKQMRTSEVNYGIAPYPKWEEKDEYKMPVSEYWSSWIVVPSTVADTTNVGYMLDAMGYYSQQYVTPAFVENAVTIKTLRDEESEKILSELLQNKVFDIGSFFDWGSKMLYEMAQHHNKNFASTIAKNRAKIEESIEATVELYK